MTQILFDASHWAEVRPLEEGVVPDVNPKQSIAVVDRTATVTKRAGVGGSVLAQEPPPLMKEVNAVVRDPARGPSRSLSQLPDLTCVGIRRFFVDRDRGGPPGLSLWAPQWGCP
jgi:hypothetical protein